jgi:predicted dehydrogenase
MVGGGDDAFIGPVHRSAAALDNALALVCGAFASDARRSHRAGAALHLKPERCYPDYQTMFREEAARPAGERMQFAAIVTPNHLHFPVAMEALRHGFHVFSEKPATLDLEECRRLAEEVKASGLLYGVAHPYAAYPIVIEAQRRIAAGELGTIRKVLVEYVQGWLAEPAEHQGNIQARWRLDPEKAGASCTMGDIGVHAFNLAERVTGLRVTDLCATLNSTLEGRVLDDDGATFLRFDNGAHGVLMASQVCTGEENDLRLRVYGDKAGIEWRQEEPNSLWIRHARRPAELVRAGWGYLADQALAHTRLPPGHPEGYIEAFGNLYRGFAAEVRAFEDSARARPAPAVPGIEEALRGMAFIETVVAASASEQKWHRLPATP